MLWFDFNMLPQSSVFQGLAYFITNSDVQLTISRHFKS